MFHHPRYFGSFIVVSLVLFMGLATACDGLIQIRTDTDQVIPTQAPPAMVVPVAATAVPPTAAATPVASPISVQALECPGGQRVELSVLVEPLDTGAVELPGSVILTTGGATPVCKDDQINVIARPAEGYRFDHWEEGLTGRRATQAIVMTQSKLIRAIFVKADTATQEPTVYHSISINGQTVQSQSVGLEGGSVAISPPPPGGGQSPYPAGFMVMLTPRGDEGYEENPWSGDCGGVGPCQLVMNNDKNLKISFSAINHKLTTSASPAEGGSVSLPGSSSHPHKAIIILEPKPNGGFRFDRWSGDCDGRGLCPLVMDGPKSVTAIFVAVQLTLATNAQPSVGGTVTPSGVNSYEWGVRETIDHSAAHGYEFFGWTGACSGAGACEVAMRQDLSVTANFRLIQRTLYTRITPREAGSVSPLGNTGFEHGESVTITPKPAQGYRFVNWSGDCSGRGSCTLIMDRDRIVIAVFEPIQFTLRTNASPTNGGVLSPQGPRTYSMGTDIVITPVPAPGYKFLRWSGDCSGETASCTLNMTQDRTVTAEFSRIQRTLTTRVTPSAGGTVNPAGTSGYQHGERVTINAQPSADYTFVRWEGDCSGETASCTLNMTQDRTVTAEFSRIQRTLTTRVTPSAGGTVNPSGTNGYQHGERVTINAQPSADYTFVRWEGDCSGSGSCTVVLNGNKSVTAVFAAEEPILDPAYSQWMMFVKAEVYENYDAYVPQISDFGPFNRYVDDGNFLIRIAGGSIYENSVVGFRTWLYHKGRGSHRVGITGDDGVALNANGEFIAGRSNAEDHANYGTLVLNSGWNKIEALVYNGPTDVELSLDPMLSTFGVIDANAYDRAPVPTLGTTLTTTATPAGGGSVSPPGTQTREYGSSVTVTGTPAAGYKFTGWSGDCSGTGDCHLVMDGDKSVTAVFAAEEPSPDPAYSQWKRFVKPGVDENPNTYVPRIPDFGDLDSVVDDGPFLIRGGSMFTNSVVGFRTWLYHEGTGSYQVGVRGDDGVALYANGAFISGRGNAEDPMSYGTLELNSGWNKIEALVYNGPWSISLQLEPVLSTIGIMDANAYDGAPVPALRTTLTTTATPAGGGSVSPPGDQTREYGSSVTVTATPATGYKFTGWSGDCSGTGDCVLVMDGSKSVTANFERSGDAISLRSGTINGKALEVDAPTVSLTPGEAISGVVNIRVTNSHGPNAIFPVGATSTWGDHEQSYWSIDSWAPGPATTQYTVQLDLTAPTSPGTYAIIFAALAETSLGHVLSATHWTSGGPRWNNGDDIASWDASQIESAIANGHVNAPSYGFPLESNRFGAAAITVVVTPAP